MNVRLRLVHGNQPQAGAPLDQQVRDFMRELSEWEEQSEAFAEQTAAAEREMDAVAEAMRKEREMRHARREGRMVIHHTFSYTLGHTAIATELGTGGWQATIGDDVREEASTSKDAIRKAIAKYLRNAADQAERGEGL